MDVDSQHTDSINHFAMSPDGSKIVTGAGGKSEVIKVWVAFPSKSFQKFVR